MSESAPKQNEKTAAPELIAFHRVERAFGRLKALASVDFSIAPGAFVGLLAPAGSGKTAILNLCVGLGAPDHGTITFNGRDISRHLPIVRNEVGAVMGAADLELDRTVRSNLRFAADLYGLRRNEAGDRMTDLLGRFHLAEHERDLVRSLADSQRRRVAIVRAMLHRPRLLLLNGIADGLEPAHSRALLEETRGLCSQENTAVVWATDREDEVTDADRLLVLRRGRIAFEGAPDELKARTGHSSLSAAIDELTGAESTA